MSAVRGKAGTQKIFARAIRTNALDFHPAKLVANRRDINEPAEVSRPEVIAQPDVHSLAACEAVAGNYVWRERDNAVIESASDGWHVMN